MQPDRSLEHAAKVGRIAAELDDLTQTGQPFYVHKGGVPHVVPLPSDPRRLIKPLDISGLDQVLEIDPDKRIAVVEPGVTFAELVKHTLRFGLVPKVVPELEGISVGGAIAGCSVESMSFRHGGLHDTCVEYEVVTSDGQVRQLSREGDPLLFGMVHGSYGTLAVLSKITLQLVPAKPFVRLEYVHFDSIAEFYRVLLQACADGRADFVDAIIHSPEHAVLCLGRFADNAPYVSDYRWLNIFYKSTRRRREDYLRTADYFFRYDAECHWLTRTVPPLEWKPVRFALGKFVLGSTNLIRWSRRLRRLNALKRRPEVVCDVFIPSSQFERFFGWYAQEFDFFPLWIVPYKIREVYPWIASDHAPRLGNDFMIDCAIYGKKNDHPTKDYSQILEEKTFELGGLKTLIGRNHYSPERFWSIYNRANYTVAKDALDPRGAFRQLSDAFGRVD